MGNDETAEVGHTNPLPTWFRLDRSNIAHLERLIYDEKGNDKDVSEDVTVVSKWTDAILRNPREKSTRLKCLCTENDSTSLWDYTRRFKLEDEAEPRIIVLYLLHEVKMEMIKRVIEYLIERRNEMDLKNWFILVGYFFDRLNKLSTYSTSSLEMDMPKNLFNMLLKEKAEPEPLLRYVELFYDAMRWFTIDDNSHNPKYRQRNEHALDLFENEGHRIFNKQHRIKSLQKKFFSYVKRADKELYSSLYAQTSGMF